MAYALPLQVEERRVVESFRRQDPKAFESLFLRYSSPLASFCGMRLVATSDAEDAVQETLIRACEAFPRFRSGARIWPWLATIAANVCTDINRERARLVHDPALSLCEECDRSDEQPPEERVLRKLRVQILSDALDSLPQRYRSHINLRDLEGWSYEEIARFFGSSMPSVKSTLLRARQKLKERVQEVAEARGQWPLPAIAPLGLPRLRTTLERWAITIRHSTWTTSEQIGPGRIFELLNSAGPAVSSAAAAAVVAVSVIGALAIAAPRVDAQSSGAPAVTAEPSHAKSSAFSQASGTAAGNTPQEVATTDDDDLEAASDADSETAFADTAESESASTSSGAATTSTSSNSTSGTTSQTVQTESGGSSGSSIEIEIAPASTGGDSSSSVETPQPSGTVDRDTSDDDSGAEADPGPANVNCEDPGVVVGAVCTVAGTTEEIEPLPTVFP